MAPENFKKYFSDKGNLESDLYFDISFIFFDKELAPIKIVSTFNKYMPVPA